MTMADEIPKAPNDHHSYLHKFRKPCPEAKGIPLSSFVAETA